MHRIWTRRFDQNFEKEGSARVAGLRSFQRSYRSKFSRHVKSAFITKLPSILRADANLNRTKIIHHMSVQITRD